MSKLRMVVSLLILFTAVSGIATVAFFGYNQLRTSPPAPSEGGAIKAQTFPRERWENLSEIFILDEAGTLNRLSVFGFRIRYVGPESASLQLFWDSQTILIEQLDPGQNFTVMLASDYVRSESTFYYVGFEVELCLCEPPSSDCRVIEGTLEFYLERFGDTLQPLKFPPGERYAALSYLEREAVVVEVVRRLRGEGYFEKIVGFGYSERGFEVLFEDEADPRVLTIVREVIGDLPLDILENAEVITIVSAEFNGPRFTGSLEGLRLEVVLSSSSVKIGETLQMRVNLTGPKAWNVGLLRFAMANSNGEKVYDVYVAMPHRTLAVGEEYPQEYVFYLDWEAKKSPTAGDVEVTPGLYSFIVTLEVEGKELEVRGTMDVK